MRRVQQFPAAKRLQAGRRGNQPAGLVLPLYEEDLRLTSAFFTVGVIAHLKLRRGRTVAAQALRPFSGKDRRRRAFVGS